MIERIQSTCRSTSHATACSTTLLRNHFDFNLSVSLTQDLVSVSVSVSPQRRGGGVSVSVSGADGCGCGVSVSVSGRRGLTRTPCQALTILTINPRDEGLNK